MAQEDGERLGKGNLSLPDVVAQSVGYMGPVFSGTFFIPTIVGLSARGQGRGHRQPVRDPAHRRRHARAWPGSSRATPSGSTPPGALYDYVGEGFGKPIGLLRRLGLLRRGDDAHARHRPRLRRLREPHAADASTTSTSTGSGSRSAFWIVAWAISVLGVRISTRAQLAARARLGRRRLRLVDLRHPQGRQRRLLAAAVQPGRVVVHGHHLRHRLRRADLRRLRVGGQPGRGDGRARSATSRAPSSTAWSRRRSSTSSWPGRSCWRSASTSAPCSRASRRSTCATANPDFGGDTFSEIVQWLVVIDIAAVGLGTATGTTRGVFALARDGHLPSALAAVHPRFKTPHVAASGDRDRGHRRGADRALQQTASRPARRPIRRATGSRSSSSAPRSARSCSSASTC